MMSWWLWTLVGVLALVGESVTMALFLLYVGVAALIVAVLAVVHVREGLQVGAFIALSVALVALVRPRMLQALVARTPTSALTNGGALSERPATVVARVTRDGGTVRVGNAEFWSARAIPSAEAIEAGCPVRIRNVDGLTAYVAPVDGEDALWADTSTVREHAS